jgi:hypothetical protein
MQVCIVGADRQFQTDVTRQRRSNLIYTSLQNPHNSSIPFHIFHLQNTLPGLTQNTYKMDLVAGVRKEGSRGGTADFKWSDVQASGRRENYLGHSLMAPVGRWQKNKDLNWYAKAEGAATTTAEEDARKEREEEIRRIKQAEQEALSAALGYEINPDGPMGAGVGSGANAIAVPGRMGEVEATSAENAKRERSHRHKRTESRDRSREARRRLRHERREERHRRHRARSPDHGSHRRHRHSEDTRRRSRSVERPRTEHRRQERSARLRSRSPARSISRSPSYERKREPRVTRYRIRSRTRSRSRDGNARDPPPKQEYRRRSRSGSYERRRPKENS